MKDYPSSLVNPSTFSSVSQYFRTLTLASCRAVAATRQLGSTRPWTISENMDSFTQPPSTRRTLDWLWRMKSKNLPHWSSPTSRGRSWSPMASQKPDWTLRHLIKSTITKFVKQFPVVCFPVAQSKTIFFYSKLSSPYQASLQLTLLGAPHILCAGWRFQLGLLRFLSFFLCIWLSVWCRCRQRRNEGLYTGETVPANLADFFRVDECYQ